MKLPSFFRREPPPAETPHRLCDRPSVTPQQPGRARVSRNTLVSQPSGSLRSLPPEERALVAYCCVARSASALELLELVDATKAGPVLRSAQAVVKLERAARVALFSREISPSPTAEAKEALLRELRIDRPWVIALSSQLLPAELRQELDSKVSEAPPAHPALVGHARRRIARHLGG